MLFLRRMHLPVEGALRYTYKVSLEKGQSVISRNLLSLIVFGAVVAGAFSYVQAAPPAPAETSCDPVYYDTLESRAWLEAQREITQNQNLISKPDSVLRYSCFDKLADDFASATGSMFSGGADVSVAQDTADSFVQTNFSDVHNKALGGRSSNVNSALDGSCDAMQKVWEQSQCMNFADNPDTDAFFTIQEYVDNAASDKRFEASCPEVSGWSGESEALLPENTAWEEDLVTSFLPEFVTDDDCDASLQVATGVTVGVPGEDGAYLAKVCVKSGCVYSPSSATSGVCHEPCGLNQLWDGSACVGST